MTTASPTGTRRSHAGSANRLLLQVARHGGPWITGLVAAIAALTVAEAALPAVLGKTIDAILNGDPSRQWLFWSGVVVVVLVSCDVVDELGSGISVAHSTAWLRKTAVRRTLAARPSALSTLTAGDIAARLVGNAGAAGGAGAGLVSAASSLALAVAGVVALALIDPWLCITFVVGMPVLVAVVAAFARRSAQLNDLYFETQGLIASRLTAALSGARSIAAAGTTEREIDRVLAPLDALHENGLEIWRAEARVTTQDIVTLSLMEIAVLAVAGIEVWRGRLSPGELFAASQYVVLAATFSSAVSALTGLVRGRSAVSRVAELLTLPSVEYGDTPLPDGPGRLELCDVTLRIGDEVGVEHLDLVIPGGSIVAVVGRSDAGCAHLASLMGRLADPDEGEVTLDGVRLRDLDRRTLRSAIGYGLASPTLIGETVGDAVAFGGHTPGMEGVVAAAASAHADAFIRRLPAGYETTLTDAPMSGGEVQRVGLARTFAHADRLLVLDDVVASLDTVTEHEIARALTEELGDRTRVVVAQRASTASRADLVVWLQRGRLRAVASHDDLWSDPDYRAVFDPRDPVLDGDSSAAERDVPDPRGLR